MLKSTIEGIKKALESKPEVKAATKPGAPATQYMMLSVIGEPVLSAIKAMDCMAETLVEVFGFTKEESEAEINTFFSQSMSDFNELKGRGLIDMLDSLKDMERKGMATEDECEVMAAQAYRDVYGDERGMN